MPASCPQSVLTSKGSADQPSTSHHGPQGHLFQVPASEYPCRVPQQAPRVHKDLSVLPLWSGLLSNSTVARGGVRSHFLRSLWFGLSSPSGFLRTGSCLQPGQERRWTLKTPAPCESSLRSSQVQRNESVCPQSLSLMACTPACPPVVLASDMGPGAEKRGS